MKAIVIQAPGGPEQLVVQDVETPTPDTAEVLIRVKAFGINRSETLMRKGLWGKVAQITGIECVGEVALDPSGKLAEGQTVAAIMGGMGRSRNGSYAELVTVPASNVFSLETSLEWTALAAIPESYATAWGCLHQNMHLSPGDTVFVRGGTSALALAAINIASNTEGVTVFASTRSSENRTRLEQAGCARVFIEGEELSQQVRQARPGGVASVLDVVGNTTLFDSLKMVTAGGYVSNAGFLGGGGPLQFSPVAALPPSVNLNFFGSFMFGKAAHPLSDIPMQSIVNNVAQGKYAASPAQIFAFKDIVRAHELMEANGASGKIVVHL